MRPVFRRLSVPAVAVATAVAAGLSSCGGPETNGLENATATVVGERAVEAFRGAESVRVVGDIDGGGRDDGSKYDVVLTDTSTTGTVERHGARHEIIKIGDDVYVRADRRYYEALGEADAAGLLAGRWVRLTEAQADEYRYFTQEGLALAVTEYVGALDGPVATVTLGDEKAVSASSPDGSTLWAANAGEPFPLRLEMSGTDTGTLEFSEYGADVSVEAPTDALDFARIG